MKWYDRYIPEKSTELSIFEFITYIKNDKFDESDKLHFLDRDNDILYIKLSSYFKLNNERKDGIDILSKEEVLKELNILIRKQKIQNVIK